MRRLSPGRFEGPRPTLPGDMRVAAPAGLDWSAPWLSPYRDCGPPVQARWQQDTPLWEALNALRRCGMPCFVAAPPVLPQGYEQHVGRHGEVPTRENVHDLLNGLVWLRFPDLKRRLNELHLQAPPAPPGRRGPLRDALTLLDENGALFEGPQALWEALKARQWRRLFIELRPLWRDARLTLVGHGLLEQLAQPRKPLTAHVLHADTPLTAEVLSAKPFAPLPVLGVPGWWPANESPSFYDDPQVFRPARP